MDWGPEKYAKGEVGIPNYNLKPVKLCLPYSQLNLSVMNPLSIKQIQQIAREYNVSFEIDESCQLPIVFSQGIILKPSIQYEDKHDDWKLTGNQRKTASQLTRMTEIKDLLNGKLLKEWIYSRIGGYRKLTIKNQVFSRLAFQNTSATFAVSNTNEGTKYPKNQLESIFRPKKVLKFKFSEEPQLQSRGFFL